MYRSKTKFFKERKYVYDATRREDRYYKFVVENELGLGAIYKKFN